MHFEFLIEELSAEKFLDNILPGVFQGKETYCLHSFRGKRSLLSELPNRLRAYKKWVSSDCRIVVLVDKDRQDCGKLKKQLEQAALAAGFATKSSAGEKGEFQVINRLAIEELEAWFFGDIQAVTAAYPRVPSTLTRKAKYRNPDAIAGGTWEALERILKRYGYYPNGLLKVEAAEKISQHMDIARNISHSFGVFVGGIRACLAGTV